MDIRSYMVVNNGTRSTLYVLAEGAVKDCAVYMREFDRAVFSDNATNMTWLVHDVAARGGKVSFLDIDALPFKIPSDLEYRA